MTRDEANLLRESGAVISILMDKLGIKEFKLTHQDKEDYINSFRVAIRHDINEDSTTFTLQSVTFKLDGD